MKKPDAKALLAALQGEPEDDTRETTPPIVTAPKPEPEVQQAASTPKAPPPPPARSKTKAKAPRSELKHIGGYLDDETVEKVALLRIRLKLENSDLLKLAIDELFRKHSAKRAFGDV
jgi:hypothetical protein